MANDHIISTQKACGAAAVYTTMIKFNEAFFTGEGNGDPGYSCVHTWPDSAPVTSCCVITTDEAGPSKITKTFQQIAQAITEARRIEAGAGTFADPYLLGLY
jgi:hypothetical protein